MKLTKQIVSAVLAALMLASAISVSAADVVPADDEVKDPTYTFEFYRDAEHTDKITGELPADVPVYYTLSCAEGYRAAFVRSNAEYIDEKYLLTSDPENLTVTADTYLMGDFSHDGQVDMTDLLVLIQYQLEISQNRSNWEIGGSDYVWKYHINFFSADFNMDSEIGMSDILLLVREICGWDSQYPAGIQEDFYIWVDLDEETANKIKQSRVDWAIALDPEFYKDASLDDVFLSYYGTYNGSVAVEIRDNFSAYPDIEYTEIIDDLIIPYGYPRIHVLKDGTSYFLDEAYEQGLLSKTDLIRIADIQNG